MEHSLETTSKTGQNSARSMMFSCIFQSTTNDNTVDILQTV